MKSTLSFVVTLTMLIGSGCAGSKNQRLTFGSDGIFKIVHISDTHYELGATAGACVDVFPAGTKCDRSNTTSFIASLLESEKPDLVVHTGDIVDYATFPSHEGMDAIYGVSQSANVPWVASMGNHEQQADLSRHEVVAYIVGMGGLGLTQVNPLGPNQTIACGGAPIWKPTPSATCSARFGTYYLEIFASHQATKASFRTFHFDSTYQDIPTATIIPEQVGWFTDKAKALKAQSDVPAVAFFHIPLREMEEAVNATNATISGHYQEQIGYSGSDPSFFNALLKDGAVKATFSGHDHTNDFCVKHPKGINLCYEGSPGYQAYGFELAGYARRARVTEISGFGQVIRSWKRLDDDAMTTVDNEVLWAAPGQHGQSAAAVAASAPRKTVDASTFAALPRRSQKGLLH